MNIIEAVTLAHNNPNIVFKRKYWVYGLARVNKFELIICADSKETYKMKLLSSDIMADDWEVKEVKPDVQLNN